MIEPDIDGYDKFSSACLFVAGLWCGATMCALVWAWSLL